VTTPPHIAPRLRRYSDVLPLPPTYFPLDYLTTFCGLIKEVKQKPGLSLLRAGEEYGEVETYVIARQRVKALLFAQFSRRDGAPGSSSTERRISLTPGLLCSCYRTMPGLLLFVCRTFPTSLTVRNTSSFLKLWVQMIFPSFPSTHLKNSQVFLPCFPKSLSFSNIQS
jgi:hypothetical protein